MLMTKDEYRSCIAEALLPEYQHILDEADDSYNFSPRFEKRMKRLIRQRRKPYYRFINTAGKRVAVIALAFLTISFTTVMSVEALRTPFLDFIMSIFSDHSEVRTVNDSGDLPDKIESFYEITADLSGYSIERDESNEKERAIIYRRGDDIISFRQIVVQGFGRNYNTEDAVIESIDINGYETIGFFDNQNYYTLIWNNGRYIIKLASNIGKDALIETAKTVNKVELPK